MSLEPVILMISYCLENFFSFSKWDHCDRLIGPVTVVTETVLSLLHTLQSTHWIPTCSRTPTSTWDALAIHAWSYIPTDAVHSERINATSLVLVVDIVLICDLSQIVDLLVTNNTLRSPTSVPLCESKIWPDGRQPLPEALWIQSLCFKAVAQWSIAAPQPQWVCYSF